MKIRTFIVLAALLIAATVLAQQSNQDKVICELSSGNCLKQSDIIQKKIKKLNAEIKKGDKKYSPEQLKKLEQKLQETQDMLDKMEPTK
jgi:Skp family chaperone for outer membrane proteins